MFSQVGVWYANFTSGYVAGVTSTLATWLAPIALLMLTAWIYNYGYAVLRNEVHEPLQTFAWKMAKNGAILAFVTSAGLYLDVVYNTLHGLQGGMATLFIRAADYGSAAPSSVFGALEAADDKAMNLLAMLLKDLSIWRLDLLLPALFFSVGMAVFMTAGLIYGFMSNVFLDFGACIGLIAILLLMFRTTDKFFYAWKSFMLSAMIMAWFVFFALGLGFFIVDQTLRAIDSSGAFRSGGFVGSMKAAGTILVFNLALSYVVYKASTVASALTGGPTLGTGAALVAGAVLTQMIRHGGGRNYSNTQGGGAIQQATPLTLAGAAVGNAARAGAQTAVHAYQRLAQRNNSRLTT